MSDTINDTISAATDKIQAAKELITEAETKADEAREALSVALARQLMASADLADFEATFAETGKGARDVEEATHRYEREHAKVNKLRNELDALKLDAARARARLELL